MSGQARAFPAAVLFPVFVLSGISALIYQMVWQRALLNIYGSNVESVAMVVAAFLMGLGFGSLAGGAVSKRPGIPPVLCFAVAEFGVGVYGLVSLGLFRWVGGLTSGVGPVLTGVMAFALVFVPTLLMGATLPLLVAHQVKACAHVGMAVSHLYFVNTLGAALGALLAVFVVLGGFGMSGAVKIAALLNLIVMSVVLITWLVVRKRRA